MTRFVDKTKLDEFATKFYNKTKFKDNYVDTFDPASYAINGYLEKNGFHLDYRENRDTYFRLKLVKALEVGVAYTLSFDCSGVVSSDSGRIGFSVSHSSSNHFYLVNGKVSVTFKPNSSYANYVAEKGFPCLLIDDDNGYRPNGADIRLTNFCIEEGEEASCIYRQSLSSIEETVDDLVSKSSVKTGGFWSTSVIDDKYVSAGRSWPFTTSNEVTYTSGIKLSKFEHISLPFPIRSAGFAGTCDRSGRYITSASGKGSNDCAVGYEFRLGDPSGATSEYTTYVRFLINGQVGVPPDAPQISYDSSIAQQIVDVAKTYTYALSQGRKFSYGNNFFYYNDNIVNNGSGYARMECDTFAGLVLRGVEYKDSPYASASSNIYANDEPNKTITYDQMISDTSSLSLPTWAINLRTGFSKEEIRQYLLSWNSTTKVYEPRDVRFASDYEWFFWMTPKTLFKDISYVKPGDVAFWRSPGNPDVHYFDSITHVAIVGDNDDIYEITGEQRSNTHILNNMKIADLKDHMPTRFARPYGFTV